MINNLPALPKLELDALKNNLQKCTTYLEYGCGGSTIMAANMGVSHIYYVDTSEEWLKKVEYELNKKLLDNRGIWCDVGPVQDWGIPIGNSKIQNWKNYCYAPWEFVFEYGNTPQLVMVDGRFRIASFLVSLILSEPETVILFDDYKDREYYHIIENIIAPHIFHNRMAEFIRPSIIDTQRLLIMLLTFTNDPR